METRLLDLLVAAGLIDADQFEEALRNRMLSGGRISTSLLEIGLMEEDQLARFLSRRLGIAFFDPLPLTAIPEEVLSLLPAEKAVEYRVLPLSRDRGGLSLAMADPSDNGAIEALAALTGCSIKPLAAPEVRLLLALQEYYHFPLEPREQKLLEKCDVTERPSLTLAFDVEVDGELEEAEVIDDEDPDDANELDLSILGAALCDLSGQQEMLSLLLRKLGRMFERAAVFQVRDDRVEGWKAQSRRQEIAGFEGLVVSLADPTVFKTVVEGKSFYLGPISADGANQALLQALGGDRPEAVLLIPLILENRVVALLYGDGDSSQLVSQVGLLQKLQEMGVLALHILILKNKLRQF